MGFLGARFALILGIFVEPTWSVRINSQTALKDFKPESFLVYGQEVLIVGCACKMAYCMKGKGLYIRDTTLTLYPRPLRTGEAKHAPSQEDCPNPARGEEEGAEGNVTKDMTQYDSLDAGTGATARVVFVKADIDGDLLTTYTGQPLREGQMAAVFAAEAYHAGDKKPLTVITISFPSRVSPIEWSSGEADRNPAIKDGELVEFDFPIVSNYNCNVLLKNETPSENCLKYGRLKDVFQFRALMYGPAPEVYKDSAKPVIANATHVIADAAQNFANSLFGTSEEDCEGAVSGSQRVGRFNFGSYKCQCPAGKSIKSPAYCLRKAKSHTEKAQGRKFNPDDFRGMLCKCS